ncbi:sigma factor sigB regulation protein rsbQ [Pseudomonas coronafaciens pv. porri]|uniref:Sigma factor sigB regulation protein rsbQ n=1 Tax=Pseudomonas coronafaciens pv. porri TaxID=83964 RepID=A0ABR5JRT0_9PSED|nr:alpha/beta hydrolase [Pseudomonas coronafaciens]KOP55249.1 sigma factor sigB regulation protein rsbQ [Pseudomonas coronafaciens pv. porri]KOP60233.1 sigma factor sigB regulation protein rsbQ [Pseudomonas coronafaciens pv. porri]KPY23825.1 Sigma factor sigB regulation protein rsbQ [Pseudomonas coronafaciens pv. porri]RMU91082.1 Sigma factor sigB regulation protein rsbQ [Pseudomonas coronafaciens pv. porri]RMV96035.1 Sigma factor sigB regulation protein rsbQ [Pseudomonas coronafaciens pv. por
MSVQQRNNVNVMGEGPATLIFAHGFGCNQHMWRFMAPHFAERFKVVLFDLVGSGQSDTSTWFPHKYASLKGYASDLLELVNEYAGAGPVIHVGHSVSCMIAVLAELESPGRFDGQVMVGPSPHYLNVGDYVGGFTRADVDSLLETLESNYLGWASTMAPTLMGTSNPPELSEELASSLCRTNAEIARQFARVTFLSDHRADVEKLKTRTLILQSSDDLVVPVQVGEYLHRVITDSTLHMIDNVGHYPHMSAPHECITAMNQFLAFYESAEHVA